VNYWYSARSNEIFLDLDSNRAIARALSVLRLTIRKRHLKIDGVWLYSTPRHGHAHMIIRIKEDLSWMSRIAWSLWLGNDRLRAAYVLRRHGEFELDHHDLLMGKSIYHRTPDAFCKCKQKHKKKSVTDKCEAMIHLLGDYRSADYFTRTGSPPPKKKIRVPWGEVSLTQLRNWENVYERTEG
jgi:hypothetical protein